MARSAFGPRRERMSVQHSRVGVTADLTVLVPRDANGGLEDGVEAVLERVDGVAVGAVDVTGLTPRLNDLAVEATAELTVDVEDDPLDPGEHAREALDGGFGVTVEALTVRG